MKRRTLLTFAGAAGGLGLAACTTGAPRAIGTPGSARVLVVGGGFGGATAAKYLRLLSQYRIEVVLVEPEAAFVSCPLSNLVLGGATTLADLTRPYERLGTRHGVRVVRDSVARIDVAQRSAQLASGAAIRYDSTSLS